MLRLNRPHMVPGPGRRRGAVRLTPAPPSAGQGRGLEPGSPPSRVRDPGLLQTLTTRPARARTTARAAADAGTGRPPDTIHVATAAAAAETRPAAGRGAGSGAAAAGGPRGGPRGPAPRRGP